MMSAAASLGLSLLWDTDVGLSHIDRYTLSSEEYIKVCAALKFDILFLIYHSRPVLFSQMVF